MLLIVCVLMYSSVVSSHTQKERISFSSSLSPFWDYPHISSSQGLLSPGLWKEIWGFSWSFSCLCCHHVLHEQDVTGGIQSRREKRNQKITGIPQSTSGAVLRAGPREKRVGDENQKQGFPLLSLTHRVSFSLLLARHNEVSLRGFTAYCTILQRSLVWIKSGIVKRK